MTTRTADRPVHSMLPALLFLCVLAFFFVSGACGLLYQVVWTRKLVLLFGTTSYAVSTVLSIFFTGLGLGSWQGGRLADRTPRPLRLYGAFELAIGVWAVLFLLLVAFGEDAVVAVLRAFDFSRPVGILLRGLMAFVLLFVPVALMGATLPLLAKFVNREARVGGRRIGVLYAVNTLGAVTGCFLTGFFLIASFGYLRTTLMGAAANAVIGLLALLVSRHIESPAPASSEESAAQEPAATRAFPVMAAFALSGFAMLALEVLWTRLLIIVFLGTTYAYTAMLTTLLCGIALGSAAAALIADRVRGHRALFGGTLILNGVCCVLMLGWLADLPAKLAQLQQDAGYAWDGTVRGMFVLSFAALFLPTFFSGMTFPLAVKAVGRGRDRLGRDVGRLYSANTIGGVLGALAGGFVIIPMLGTHCGILSLAALLAVAGAWALLSCPETLRWGKAVALIGGVAFFAWALHRAPADVSQALNAGYIPAEHRIIHYREGVEGTVAVSEPTGETGGTNRVLWINRVQATASIEKGVKMNRLQGVLPLLFDRDPKDVLFMCFGSGITCGTLALSDFDRVDAVEISPDVIAAAPLFAVDNLDVLKRPKLHVHIDDGRNYLLTTRQRYDVITFEPMPLALAGVSTFYTREYYELCLGHLKPGGLVSQWVPLHSLNLEVVESLTYTFTQVFPDYCAFFINADMFLVGSNQALHLDYPRLEQRLAQPEVKRALERVGLCDVPEVVAAFLMDKAALDGFASGGLLMTDDRPWAEFVAPKLVYESEVEDSLGALQLRAASPEKILLPGGISAEALAALRKRHEAHVHDLVGLRQYYGGMAIGSGVRDAFMQSLRMDPGDCNARYYLQQVAEAQGRQLLRWQNYGEAKDMLESVLPFLSGDPAIEALLGDAYWGLEDQAAARNHYRRHLELGGVEAQARERAQSQP